MHGIRKECGDSVSIHEKTSCLSRKHTLVFVAAVGTSRGDRGISWTSG